MEEPQRREIASTAAREADGAREECRVREAEGAKEEPAGPPRGHAVSRCPKNRVNWFTQALLGRSCAKDQDIIYIVSEQCVDEETKYSCALTFPTQDASQHFTTGLFHSRKEAEMEAGVVGALRLSGA